LVEILSPGANMPETSARSLISNHDGRWKSATIR
jgi:hypothetical protein